MKNKRTSVLAVFLTVCVFGCSDSKKSAESSNVEPVKQPPAAAKENTPEIPKQTPVDQNSPANPSESSASGPTSSSKPTQGTATIRGVVTLNGTAPARKKYNIATSPECVARHKDKEIPLEQRLVVHGGKIEYAVAYIAKGLEAQKFEAPKTPVTLDQVDCVYVPHVIAMQAGQELLVLNSDPFAHNVKAVAERNKPFNEAMTNKGMKLSKTFTEAEFIPFQCDIHPFMSARVAVFNHPFFAVTNANGSFEIKDVPPGKYEIRAFQEYFYFDKYDKKAGKLPRLEVEVKAGEVKEITLEFKME